MDTKESIKTLGVCVTPAFKWVQQFKLMKEKMCRVMNKLRSTPLTITNVYVYFNIYFKNPGFLDLGGVCSYNTTITCKKANACQGGG